MADVDKHLYLRDRRDRLIDLLGLGETMPLRDLPVAVERLVVPENTEAGIPIYASQRDCTYALWERSSETLAVRADGNPASEPGSGETIMLMSPSVDSDIGYRIRSTRAATGRWVYLHELAEIKVGFNAQLSARVISGTWLDPMLATPGPKDARLVDYGTEVEVEVEYSQNGVDYSLVRIVEGIEETISQSVMPGNFRTIILRTIPLIADTELRIRVSRAVAGSGGPEIKQTVLDTRLPVVVAPHLESTVTVVGSHILDHASDGTIAISASQISVEYQLFSRQLDASDFRPDASSEDNGSVVQVAGEGEALFSVKRPAPAPSWVTPPGYASISGAHGGTGGELQIPAGQFAEDTMILVQASRTVLLSANRTLNLKYPLRQVAVVLVRPDSTPPLRIQVLMADDATRGAVRMLDGQRGARYHLRQTADGPDLGRPGFFYERLGTPERNVGVGLLTIGRDLVVARNPWTDLHEPEFLGIESLAVESDFIIASDRIVAHDDKSPAQRAITWPQPPIVHTGALAIGTVLHLHAVKPRTSLAAPLGHTVTIASVPAMTLQLAPPDESNESTFITGVLVAASRPDETYVPLVTGAIAGQSQVGTGQELILALAKPVATRAVDVAVCRGKPPAIVIEEIVRVTIT